MQIVAYSQVGESDYYDPNLFKSRQKYRLSPGQAVIITLDRQCKLFDHLIIRKMWDEKKKTVSCVLKKPECLCLLVRNTSASKVTKVPVNSYLNALLNMSNIRSKFVSSLEKKKKKKKKKKEEEEEDNCCQQQQQQQQQQHQQQQQQQQKPPHSGPPSPSTSLSVSEEEEDTGSCTSQCDHSDLDDAEDD
jgi:hypothetical protein